MEDNSMDEVSDFTDIFLKNIHSEEDGWKRWSNNHLGCFEADYVFEQSDDSFYQIVLRLEGPIVTSKHLNIAKRALQQFRDLFGFKNSKLLLVCGNLLVQPKQVPKDVKIVELSEHQHQSCSELVFTYELN